MPKHLESEADPLQVLEDTVDAIDETVTYAAKTADKMIEPYRRSVFKRFPTLFAILVTFGVAATFFGFERILATTPWLSEHPWYILGSGLTVLVVTGQLYKKLG